jgi:NADH dehydrogenase FAD-containing subunit
MLKPRSRITSLSAILIMTIVSSSRFLFRKNHADPKSSSSSFVADAFQSIVTSTVVRKRTSCRLLNSALPPTTTTTAAAAAADDAAAAAAAAPPANEYQKKSYHLVLIGGGHAHVQVVKALANRPHYLKVTLIDQQPTATYSGMVPGCIAGLYEPHETQIDIAKLATEYAGINFLNHAVVDIDCDNKLLYLKDQSLPISFDVISLDIGSTARDLYSVVGAAQYTIPTRPIDQLVNRLQNLLPVVVRPPQQADDATITPPRIVVVGGGVAGIELSMAVSARLRRTSYAGGDSPAPATRMTPLYTTTLLDAGATLLPFEAPTVRNDVAALLDAKGVRVQHNCQVARIDPDVIYLKDGRTVPYQYCIWATGAGAHSLARQLHQTRGIACDKYGWFIVTPTLQSTSHPFVFAAGDCATIVDPANDHTPPPPKAGVYAVRSGPVLIENLTRYVDHLRQQDQYILQKTKQQEQQQQRPPPSELTLIRSKPQEDFLKLLVCGDGCALGIRFGMTIRGKWVFEMKNDIDRSFMDLFDVTKLPPPPRVFLGSYDTSQYDAQDNIPTTLSAREGAALLQRSDDNVCFREARKVLRRMGQDDSYRENVLAEVVGVGAARVLL